MAQKRERLSTVRSRRNEKKEEHKRLTNIKFIGGVCGLLSIILLMLIMKNVKEYKNYELLEASLNQQIEEQNEIQEDVKAQIAYQQTDEYVAELAREQLGLLYSNELIFKKNKN